MPHSGRLLIGTRISATRDFGPIIRRQLGVVMGEARRPRWAWRRHYVCTFLGGMTAIATGREIMRYDHDLPIGFLNDPLWFLRPGGSQLPYDQTAGWHLLRHAARD